MSTRPSEKELAQLEERKVEGYVALGREGCAVYAQRKWMAETPIGWIKHVMGFRRFSVRGDWSRCKGNERWSVWHSTCGG